MASTNPFILLREKLFRPKYQASSTRTPYSQPLKRADGDEIEELEGDKMDGIDTQDSLLFHSRAKSSVTHRRHSKLLTKDEKASMKIFEVCWFWFVVRSLLCFLVFCVVIVS